MNNGIVGKIVDINPHFNADRLDVLDVEVSNTPYVTPHYIRLVTGKHYRIGDLGIWIPDGVQISGFLAHDLWLVGKKRMDEPFYVSAMEIRGVLSVGLWAGCWYKKDNSKESALRASDHYYFGTAIDKDGYIKWPWWDDQWEIGSSTFDLSTFDPRRGSSESEQSVVNREVGGSIPPHGSNV